MKFLKTPVTRFAYGLGTAVYCPSSVALISTLQAGQNREFGQKIADYSKQDAVGLLLTLKSLSKAH